MTPPSVPLDARVLITGHRGMVGSALVRRFQQAGYTNLLTASRDELDLRDPAAVSAWFANMKPDYVVHAAGRVGGIQANRTQPADFLYDNLMIHATVLRAAWQTGVQKLLYLGSSCVYPRDCPQPMNEQHLLTGPLERTNDAYAIAKISGLMSCDAYRRQYGCNFIAAMPTNLYGPRDKFDLAGSHVVPALIRKFHDCRVAAARGEEPTVEIWGTGAAQREFLYVEDLADACLWLLNNYEEESIINVGTGQDQTIRELAETIRQVVCPEARLEFDTSKPDGTPRKLLDVSRLHQLGWRHQTELRQGIAQTYEWFVAHCPDAAALPA